MNSGNLHKSGPGTELPALKFPAEGEEKLSAVLKYSSAIIITVDRKMQIQSINRVREGLTVEGVLGTSCLDYVLPEHRALLESSIKKVFETGEASSYEIQGQGDNNTLAWYSTHLSLLNKGWENEQALLITEDITEKKRAEDALRKSESRLRAITENAPDVIAELDQNGRFTYMSRVMHGFDLEDIIGQDFCNWSPQEYHAIMRNTLEQVFQTGLPKEYEAQGSGPNGSSRWYVVRLSPLQIDNHVERAILIAHDITERKLAEEKLQESESELAQAQRVANLGNWKLDLVTNEVRWSEELYRIFDIEKTAFGGEYDSFLACIHPDDKQRILDMDKKVRNSGISFETEFRIMTPKGKFKHIRSIGHPIKDAAGKVVALFGVAQDITERRRIEEERIKQKSEERIMTNLLMDIHDGIGGITSNIALLAELALRKPMAEDLRQKVTSISELSRDGMAEIRSLMYGLDKDDLNWHSIVGELKEQSTKLLAPYHIAFDMTTDFEKGIPDPSSHVCLQLFRIYREAMINTIKHAKATKVTANVRVSQELLFLEIHDNGQGFIQTPRPIIGRGIGNMMRRAEELHGKTTVSGNVGTRVTVEIPLRLQSSNG